MAEELTRALTTLAERGEERGAVRVLEDARLQAGLDPTGRQLSPGRWRRGVLVAATAAAAVLVLIGVVTVLGPFAGDETPVTQPSGEWVAGQPIEVGDVMGPVESGFGSVWVATGNGVARIDPATQEIVATVSTPAPTDIAVGDDAVWLLSTMGGGWQTEVGPDGMEEGMASGSATRIDPNTNTVVATTPVASPDSLALVGDQIWVSHTFDNTISVLDPTSNTVIENIDIGNRSEVGMPRPIAVVGGRVWAMSWADSDDRVNTELRRYDPASRQLETTIDLTDQLAESESSRTWLEGLYGTAGDLWSVGMVIHFDPQAGEAVDTEGVVYRFDGETGELLASIPIGRGWGGSIASAGGVVYATDCLDATVTAIDVATNQVVASGFAVGRPSPRDRDYNPMDETLHSCPGGIAVYGDSLYVSLRNDGTVVPVDLNAEPGAEQQPVSTEAIPASCAECDPATIGETAILEVGDGFITLSPQTVRAADSERCPLACWLPSFRVTNTGSQVHKIDVIVDWGGQDPANLPIGGSEMGMMEGRAIGVSGISSGPEIRLQPGQTMDGFGLEPGKYLLICNEPGHYSAGEYALLTVLEPTGEPAAPRGLTLGEPAPSWEATLLDGTPVFSASLLGRPSLLVVWGGESFDAGWWPQIEQALTELETLSSETVNMWAMAIGIPPATVREHTSGYSFPVVVDEDRRIPEVWGGAPWAFPTNQPTVVLLDADGLVAQVLDHPPQPGELRDLIQRIASG